MVINCASHVDVPPFRLPSTAPRAARAARDIKVAGQGPEERAEAARHPAPGPPRTAKSTAVDLIVMGLTLEVNSGLLEIGGKIEYLIEMLAGEDPGARTGSLVRKSCPPPNDLCDWHPLTCRGRLSWQMSLRWWGLRTSSSGRLGFLR
jgi:hypothetical protein